MCERNLRFPGSFIVWLHPRILRAQFAYSFPWNDIVSELANKVKLNCFEVMASIAWHWNCQRSLSPHDSLSLRRFEFPCWRPIYYKWIPALRFCNFIRYKSENHFELLLNSSNFGWTSLKYTHLLQIGFRQENASRYRK